jgi:hypothetical protein
MSYKAMSQVTLHRKRELSTAAALLAYNERRLRSQRPFYRPFSLPLGNIMYVHIFCTHLWDTVQSIVTLFATCKPPLHVANGTE